MLHFIPDLSDAKYEFFEVDAQIIETLNRGHPLTIKPYVNLAPENISELQMLEGM